MISLLGLGPTFPPAEGFLHPITDYEWRSGHYGKDVQL